MLNVRQYSSALYIFAEMNCNSETEVHHWEKKIGTAICQPVVDFFWQRIYNRKE